eukprot:10703101-Ditylum_brightwellii.AAC.1
MKNITAARKQLRQIQHNAAEIRDAMLEEMAHDHITSDTADIATIVKNIRHREEVKTAFRLMCPIAKDKTGGTVSYIKAPIPLNSPSVYPETLSGLGFAS